MSLDSKYSPHLKASSKMKTESKTYIAMFKQYVFNNSLFIETQHVNTRANETPHVHVYIISRSLVSGQVNLIIQVDIDV